MDLVAVTLVGAPGTVIGMTMFEVVEAALEELGFAREQREFRPHVTLGRVKYARDARPLDEGCPCYTCANFSRAALRHYFLAEEMLGPTLMTIHNLAFFAQFMAAIGGAIAENALVARSRDWLERLYPAVAD